MLLLSIPDSCAPTFPATYDTGNIKLPFIGITALYCCLTGIVGAVHGAVPGVAREDSGA